MAISKSKREAVYRKYDGHCAYCGREIAYKDMQVDHYRPLRAWGIEDAGTDDLDNLMPACRMCNHYKRANSLETFRRYIAEIPRKLRENYIYKVRRLRYENPEICTQEINSIPAADVAPVVHGRWIPSESDFDDDDTLFDVEEWCDWQCSACREDICYDDPMPIKLLPNYCPNCGAKMDGGGGDATD